MFLVPIMYRSSLRDDSRSSFRDHPFDASQKVRGPSWGSHPPSRGRRSDRAGLVPRLRPHFGSDSHGMSLALPGSASSSVRGTEAEGARMRNGLRKTVG